MGRLETPLIKLLLFFHTESARLCPCVSFKVSCLCCRIKVEMFSKTISAPVVEGSFRLDVWPPPLLQRRFKSSIVSQARINKSFNQSWTGCAKRTSWLSILMLFVFLMSQNLNSAIVQWCSQKWHWCWWTNKAHHMWIVWLKTLLKNKKN